MLTAAVPAGELHLSKSGGVWKTGEWPSGEQGKRHGLHGPIDDAFNSRFLVVYGEGDRDLAVAELDALCNPPGPMDIHGDFMLKAAAKVTKQDVESFNLVLFGTPESNVVLKRLAGSLPPSLLKPGADGSRSVFIHPNPENPNHYVLVWQGKFLSTSGETLTLRNQGIMPLCLLPDYVWVKDGKITAGGHFDSDWKLSRVSPKPARQTHLPSQETPPVSAIPDDMKSKINLYADVAYGEEDKRFQLLDAYILKSPQPTPVLFHIHGGGWSSGDKSRVVFNDDQPYLPALKNGISLVSIQYRLLPKYSYPAQVNDVIRAVQFVHSKAKEWNIDPTRFAGSGFSAGAHLIAWVALHDDLADPNSADPINRQSSRVSSVFAAPRPGRYVTLCKRSGGKSGRGLSLGCAANELGVTDDSKRTIALASPLSYVSSDDPPGLLVGRLKKAEGDINGAIPALFNFPSTFGPHSVWNAEILARAMKEKQAPYEKLYTTVDLKDGHYTAEEIQAMVAFLKKHLLGRGVSTAVK